MLNKLKLRWRILLSFLLPLLLLLGVITLTEYRLNTASKKSAELVNSSNLVSQMLMLNHSLIRIERSAKAYLLTNGNQNIAQGYPKISYEQSRARINKILIELENSPGIQRYSSAFEKLKQLSEKIEQTGNQYMQLVDAGNSQAAIELFKKGDSILLSKQLDEIADNILNTGSQYRGHLSNEAKAEIDAVQRTVIDGTVIAIVLMLGFGAWISVALSRDILINANQLANTTSELTNTQTKHEQTVSSQGAAVSQATSTVEELVASARVSSEQAESAAASARTAQDTTSQGYQLATRNQNDMLALEQKMGEIAQQIVNLSEQAGQIGSIARLVSELAGETNMLALNAAVEAARAGEHGKGFAVVAGEIRKLADQSKKSAERANQIVSNIQKATNSMVMTAEDGSKTTRDVADNVRQTAEAFEMVRNLAESVYQNAQQVLLNSKQQAAALVQIDGAMKNINSGSHDIAAGTTQSRISIQSLANVAERLRSLL